MTDECEVCGADTTKAIRKLYCCICNLYFCYDCVIGAYCPECKDEFLVEGGKVYDPG